MGTVLWSFRRSLLPHVLIQREGCLPNDFGCAPSEIANHTLRSFIESSELLREWLHACIPRVRNRFRLGIGCDPKPIDELIAIYGDEGAIDNLVEQRIFVFAEDGSGLPYCLHLDSGTVFRAWSAWGGCNDKQLDEVVDAKWDSLADFTGWLKSTFNQVPAESTAASA